MDIRFLGHACFELTDGDTRVLVDPFLTGNPEGRRAGRRARPDPHLPDARPSPTTTATSSTSASAPARRWWRSSRWRTSWASRGSRTWRTRTSAAPSSSTAAGCGSRPAWHTGTTPNGTVHTPAGLVINLGGKTVYHVGDTALFSDIRLAGERDQLDAAIVCIGGHYTMDRHDAAVACEWIGAPGRDPVPLRHVPADRDGRAGVQVGRGGADRREDDRRGARAGRDVSASRATSWAPRENQTGRSFQSCATRAAPNAARMIPVAPWWTRWPQIQTRRRVEVDAQ